MNHILKGSNLNWFKVRNTITVVAEEKETHHL